MTNHSFQIFLGADHGGFELKNKIKSWLTDQAYQVKDCGALEQDPQDDYPDFAFKVAQSVAKQQSANRPALGILFCRSGAGMSIAANKIKGVRAAETWDKQSATHAREHNHANVISLGADWLSFEQAQAIVQAFVEAQPDQSPRHLRRIEKIMAGPNAS